MSESTVDPGRREATVSHSPVCAQSPSGIPTPERGRSHKNQEMTEERHWSSKAFNPRGAVHDDFEIVSRLIETNTDPWG